MNPAADVWSKVITLMQPDMTATTINTWFDDASAVALEDDRFVLYSPTRFKRDIIATRYVGKIQAALRELFSCDMDVVVLTEGELDQYSQPEKDNFFPGTEEYTFERFVVGSSNKFAHAAARAVADNPGKSYNPLFIYGESGLGKTHLLYAIAHTIHKNHPEYKVVYIKGDTFTNELIQAIREGRNAEFREKYRGADVFLMDDVQFIAGRDSTQEEMFHTFNTLYELKKQIVFTSDRPPKEMLRLEDRLKTRFEWGLLADIQPPDYETRMAIIKNKAIRMGVELPEFLLQLIAENITANVRQIEGTVNKIMAYQQLMGDSVDKDTTVSVKQILQAKIELFLLELLEQCPEAQDAAPVSRSQLVARTNEELRRHLCDSVSIEDICQRLNLSKSYLSSLYKRKTGKSIIAHFNEMKIEEARRLIASGRYNFTEIAERLGFSSIHYFSRMFKSVAGMTPSEYEKSLKKGGA